MPLNDDDISDLRSAYSRRRGIPFPSPYEIDDFEATTAPDVAEAIADVRIDLAGWDGAVAGLAERVVCDGVVPSHLLGALDDNHRIRKRLDELGQIVDSDAAGKAIADLDEVLSAVEATAKAVRTAVRKGT